MSEIPKFVVARMRQARPQSDHPDVELLSAFAEKALRESERLQVLAHVAECKDCREVLALASHAREEVFEKTPGHAAAGGGGSWFRWPMLRWGTAAACAVIVGTAVLVYRGSNTRDLKMATTDQAAPLADEGAADSIAQIQPEGSQREGEAVESRQRTNENRFSATPAPEKKFDSFERRPSAGVVAPRLDYRTEKKSDETSRDDSSKLSEKAKRVNEPSLRDQVAGYEATNRLAKNGSLASQEATRALASAAPANGRDFTGVPVSDKKENAGVIGGAAKSTSAQAPATVPSASPPPAPARSSIGQLASAKSVAKPAERGKASEESSELDSSTKLHFESQQKDVASLLARAGNNAEWSVTDGQVQHAVGSSEPMKVVPIDSSVQFLAVAAVGNTVWAGGKDGALYYSTDSGAHWTRVEVQDEKGLLSSDIVSIQFADLQHGRIVAGKNEVWMTMDGGKSWKRQ